MEYNNNQRMLLFISFLTVILFNHEHVVCFSINEPPPPLIGIPADPSTNPNSPQPPPLPPGLSPSQPPGPSASLPPAAPAWQPVSSPAFQPSITPAFQPKEYVTFPIPSFWTQPLLPPAPQTSDPPSNINAPAPSPSANPPEEADPPSTINAPALSLSAYPSEEDSPHFHPFTEQMLSRNQLSGTLFARRSTYHDYSLASTANPEIKKICSSVDRPSLCISFLTPFYSTGKIDAMSVLEKAINGTAHHIKLAMVGMTKLARSHNILSVKNSDLEDCKNSYDDALDNLQNAKDAIPNRDVGTINSMLSAAVTDFSDCDDFASNHRSIAVFDDVLTDLVSTCLVIASMI